MPIFILILVVALRLFYFQASVLPRHDTFYMYSAFYYFYNHFYYFNTWPQWMPQLTYGIPTIFFQFFALSPLSYVVMLIGKVFGISDAMFLFKLTLLSEELFFVLSLYFLIKKIFEDKWIAAAIALGSIASLETYSNVSLNLRIVYFAPLAILLLWNFIKKGEAKYFWMMVLVCVLGLMGNAIYLPMPTYYTLGVIFLSLVIAQKIKWSNLWPKDIWTKLTASLSGLLILTYGFVMVKSLTDLSLMTRETQAQNSISIFLTWGRTLDFGQLFYQLFFMDSLYSPLGSTFDNTLYVGMFMGLFLIAGLIHAKDAFFRSILGGLLFIVFLSFGGVLARVFYFLPGMSLFRHIGLTSPIIKLMVLICASYGLKYLFDQKQIATKLLVIPLMIWFAIMDGQETWHAALNSLFDSNFWKGASFWNFLKVFSSVSFLVFISFYWNKAWDKRVKIALLLVLTIQAVVFQYLLSEVYPKVDSFSLDMVRVFGHVRPIHFDPSRTDRPQGVRWAMMLMVQAPGRGGNYDTMYNTLDFDTCRTDTLVQVINKPVLDTWKKSIVGPDSNYPKIVGCDGYPKSIILKKLPLNPGEDIYQNIMPIDTQAVSFDSDRIIFKTSSIPDSAWFYYADSFHPGWKALVNDVPTKIQRTADGFKAVAVDGQTQKVEFYFFDLAIFCLEYLLCVGAIIGIGLLTVRIFI